MKAAIYARVSTSDQHNAIQIKELTDYIVRRGWELGGVYQDVMSGAKRSDRAAMRSWPTHGSTSSMPSLYGSWTDSGEAFLIVLLAIQELTGAGVRFIAVSQGIDNDAANPTSRLLLRILASVAEFERELIKERVSAGLKHAKSKGTHIGRPRRV